jgi:hypothetical protein
MKFRRQKGNADMIYTGVMRMTKFNMVALVCFETLEAT